MSEIDNNVMPLAEDPHNLGEFDNVYEAMRRYPNGGTEDDYIYILGVKHFWNTNRQTWGILKDKEDNLVQMVEDFIMLFYNKGYSFAGIAHPDTVPSEYDGVFYIAAENGTYVNFGNNIKVENEVAIISKARKGDWVKTAVAIPNNERIDGIDSLITTIQETLQAHAQAIVGIEGDIDNLYDSIDETNQDLAELGQTVEEYKELNDKKDEEQDERIEEVEERLEYIPKESFLSSEPASGYHEEDNVEELTADRAMRDRFGRMIDEEYLTRDAAKNYTQEVVDGSKLEIMPGSVKPEGLSPAVKEMIEAGAGKPGNITNLPDEEDLTVEEGHVLKFKDKEYNPYNYSGMGRVYLRKHIVNGTNILAQHMINKPNTIYIIQYDYCLGGETIEIPENCVLQFEGGSLRNGTINLNKVYLDGNPVILNCDFSGEITNEEANICWFGAKGDNATDNTDIFNLILNRFKHVFIPKGSYLVGDITIADFTGCRIRGHQTFAFRNEAPLYATIIKHIGNGNLFNIPLFHTSTLENIHIQLNDNSISAINIGRFYYSKVKGVMIDSSKDEITNSNGIIIYGVGYSSVIYDIYMRFLNIGIKVESSGPEDWFNNLQLGIYRGDIYINRCNVGIWLEKGTMTTLSGVALEGNKNMLTIDTSKDCLNAVNVYLKDCYIEQRYSGNEEDVPFIFNPTDKNYKAISLIFENCEFHSMNTVLFAKNLLTKRNCYIKFKDGFGYSNIYKTSNNLFSNGIIVFTETYDIGTAIKNPPYFNNKIFQGISGLNYMFLNNSKVYNLSLGYGDADSDYRFSNQISKIVTRSMLSASILDNARINRNNLWITLLSSKNHRKDDSYNIYHVKLYIFRQFKTDDLDVTTPDFRNAIIIDGYLYPRNEGFIENGYISYNSEYNILTNKEAFDGYKFESFQLAHALENENSNICINMKFSEEPVTEINHHWGIISEIECIGNLPLNEAINPWFGETSLRESIDLNKIHDRIGFFDTSLSKWLIWNINKWEDLDGNPLS